MDNLNTISGEYDEYYPGHPDYEDGYDDMNVDPDDTDLIDYENNHDEADMDESLDNEGYNDFGQDDPSDFYHDVFDYEY